MGIFKGQAKLGELMVEKTNVESGIVGDQRAFGDEAVEFRKDPDGGRLVGEHLITDTMDSAGGPRNGFVNFDEALKFVAQATVFNDDGAYFDNSITISG